MHLAKLLVEYKDIFAWSYLDLGMVACDIVERKLGILGGTKLVFQKKKSFSKARQEVIRKVQELLVAGIIKPIDFPKYVSNPLVVAKPGGLVCFIDFTDLNKQFQKNPTPSHVLINLWIPLPVTSYFHSLMITFIP